MLEDKHIKYAEYHNMTSQFDELYKMSKNNCEFKKLMQLIGSKDNVILAFRSIKSNNGSKTAGIDKQTIEDIEKLSVDELVKIINSKINYYIPKAVKRVEIPKNDGRTRPLGIPCMIDRLFQQCIKQILEPICEAKFYEHSYGFRPNRSVNNAVAKAYFYMQKHNLSYCVDIDIKGFFDNIDHNILIKQMWNLGIKDKKLLSIIKAMLKAPIVLPDGSKIIPDKGSPQGGILSPLLANIVLNELDWWIASQWQNFPTKHDYTRIRNRDGKTWIEKSNQFRELKRTSNLKEIHIVRYADDFKIFCRDYPTAIKIFNATKEWLKTRLNLDISENKSGITNLKQKSTNYLGFDIRLKEKGNKWVVQSHVSNKTITRIKNELVDVIKDLQHSSSQNTFFEKLNLYNAKVVGIHEFYCIATDVSIDFQKLGLEIERIVYNRLNSTYHITKTSNIDYINNATLQKYKSSKQLRYINDRPLYPIAYAQTKNPTSKNQDETIYSVEGRLILEQQSNKGFNLNVLKRMLLTKPQNENVEFYDNRISKYCMQRGKCAITGKYLDYDEIHCHHIIPKSKGGNNHFDNLVIIHEDIHRLIHATNEDTINSKIHLIENKQQLDKLNKYRRICGLQNIEIVL